MARNIYNSHDRSINFINFKPNYKTNNKDDRFGLVAFTIVHANLIMKYEN